MYAGDLGDAQAESIGTYFYDLPSTPERRNRYIYPNPAAGNLKVVSLPDVFEKTQPHLAHASFIYPGEHEHITAMARRLMFLVQMGWMRYHFQSMSLETWTATTACSLSKRRWSPW